MENELLRQVLITGLLFATIAFVAKAVVDALVRFRALRDGVSAESYAAVMAAERTTRRWAALRWGLIAFGQAAAFLFIDLAQLPVNRPAAIAALFAGAGVSQLLFHFASKAR
jgi:hypothetical protein